MTRGGCFMIRKSWLRTNESEAATAAKTNYVVRVCKLPALQNEGASPIMGHFGGPRPSQQDTDEPAAPSF